MKIIGKCAVKLADARRAPNMEHFICAALRHARFPIEYPEREAVWVAGDDADRRYRVEAALKKVGASQFKMRDSDDGKFRLFAWMK